MRPIVTLLTDFGTADGYVAQIKGVILSLAPEVSIVDISHDIAPQDVIHARFVVERYWQRFPPGTVHTVVVDPGVGTARAALAVESDRRFLVGPDNGVLSAALRVTGARVVAMAVPPDAAATFHGRDVFAPAAASLASGTPVAQLGTPYAAAACVDWPVPRLNDHGHLEGEVIVIDRFGNAITNLPAPCRPARVSFNTCELAVQRTYGDVAPDQPLALGGSSGLLEIAVREGSAARRFALSRGTRVVLQESVRTDHPTA
jgi:S-adenosylmethionine hydrolase